MRTKIITGLALGCMLVGIADAADIRFRQSGNWTNTAPANTGPGWQNLSAVPTTADMGIINWGGNTVTVSTTETIGKVRVGQDEAGNLVITSSGELSTVSGFGQNGDFTLGQGNNPLGTGSLEVQSGGILNVAGILYNANRADGTANISGTVNVGSHLWTGWNSGFTGTYNINDGGELNVSGMLGLNWQNNGGIGIINVNDGGTLNLAQLHGSGNSIQGSSLLTIAEGGVMYKSENFVSVINQYITDGKIVGAGGATLDVSYDSGNNRTVVSVIPEPATIGLVALFGGGMLFMRRRLKI